jgi:alkaline phosphatase
VHSGQRTRNRLILILTILLFWVFAGLAAGAPPRNVVILIGDGMGFEQVKAAGMYKNGSPGTLAFEAFPHTGQVTTYSANSSVTDSAAAATAIATGFKVNNDVISVLLPGDGRELQTLLEFFKALGRSTGLVTTTYITHATPAGFGAHEPSRNSTNAIAADYLTQTRPDVLFGGGAYGMSASSAQAAGYTVVSTAAEMLALDTETAAMVSGQFGSGQLPYELGWNSNLPHLSQMAETALHILDNDPDGFFLMIEGGLIDWAGHANHLPNTVWETIEFAETVQKVVDWAAGRTDTLIIVTADHETGGLTVTANNGINNYPTVTWSTTGHTGANVPVYALGANARLISGTMDNTGFFAIVTAEGCEGDFTGDGDVDGSDLARLAANSGTVDLGLFAGQFGGDACFQE